MWIFWHDWWPWYLGGMTVFTIATGVLLAVLKRRDRPKPCVPISCPPAEKFTITGTIIRCPHCDMHPYSTPSMWEVHDRYDWICAEHGLVFIAERLPDGRLEMRDA